MFHDLLGRRQFLQYLGILGGTGLISRWALAVPTAIPEVLQGSEFSVTIAQTPVNITGALRTATTVNGSIPAPTLVWREGDTITLHVTNSCRGT